MVEPVRNRRHGDGDRNDDDVAKKDAPNQKERDREVREDQQDIDSESRRKTGAG
ncbi:hypothetical protein [Rhodanobacter sp. Root561]|jgi:hypothetical protein|uniref:hypothetical protein n=1 Tax=Rhodanobacter sp. Root561 TaxID=1736560 RepID=UPI000AE3E068|nr:hypothetical protein [Rhodanobacter sp. Root561]